MTTIQASPTTDLDRLCIDTIRMLSIDAVEAAKSGHPGTPMALAPIGYVLYRRVTRHSPQHPDWPDRDRFVLSAGHASMLLYSLLYLTGYDLSLDDIKRFRQLGSRCAGHPEYDDNHISIEGGTALADCEDVAARFEAYGWHVQHLGEDLDPGRIENATWEAMDVDDRPSLIICRTHIAPGAPTKQDSPETHGAPLGEGEARRTKEAYGWPTDPPFHVPDDALAHMRECVQRGRDLVWRWRSRSGGWDGYSLPEGWDADVPTFSPDDTPTMATRKAGGEALQWAAAAAPQLVGDSADLTPSTLQVIRDAGDVRRGSVVRPADANETALAYRFALAQERTPTAIILTRQGVPVLGPEVVPATAVERGAYIVHEAARPLPDAILVASGSEVHLCLRAAALLRVTDIEARVVSMPCVERFEEQEEAYRDEVLLPGVRARVCVEALSPRGWDRFAGDAGEAIGLTTFGASAPADDLFEHFGFTPERVAEATRRAIARTGG